MAYIGNQLQTAQPNYQIIDDISGSFDGTTTTFALQVAGVTPTPFPVSAQHCIISVGGVVQEPDPTGTNGFLLSGSNIVFSSAPSSGESFFGTVLAGADYINVGASFPDGSVANPSITFDQDLDTGLYRSASGSIAISGNGTERARIDDSGRLLVGTSTRRSVGGAAPADLQVEVSGSKRCASFVRNGGSPILAIGTTGATGIGDTTLVSDGDILGQIEFAGADGTDLESEGATIAAVVDGTPGANDMPGRLVFSTTADGASSPTERMRIASTGTVIIGDSMIADNTDGEGILFTNGGFIRLGNATGSGSSSMAQFKTGAGNTEVLRFRCDGDIENLNGRYTQISDATLKENIVDAGSQWDDIKNIRIRKYNLRGDLGYSTHTQIGVVAQEIELVCPGLVNESYDLAEDGSNLETSRKSVATSVLYMKAVKALQEAIERIETLEASNAALEARLTALEEGSS